MPVTFGAVRKIALALDGVEEALSYGAPAFKVQGVMIARLRDELGALVVRMGIDEREALIAEDSETYFVTDHYLKYPYVLVNLARVHPDALRDLLRAAWRSASAEKRGTKKRPSKIK